MTNETMKDGERAAKDAFVTLEVKGLQELDTALDRADSKGHLPDDIRSAWEGLDWRAASPQSGEKEIARLEKVGREFEGYFGHITPEEACRTINELLGKLNARAAAPQAALTDSQIFEIAADWGMHGTLTFARALIAAQASQAPTERMSDAVRDVLAERARQVSEEGFTPTRDDSYADGQLAQAGAAYAIAVADHTNHIINSGAAFYTRSPDIWPWSEKWWKPTNPRRALVKAAALILAEIERIDRAARKAEIERSGGSNA